MLRLLGDAPKLSFLLGIQVPVYKCMVLWTHLVHTRNSVSIGLQYCLLTTYLLRFRYRSARLRAVGLRYVTILHACRIGDQSLPSTSTQKDVAVLCALNKY